MSMNTYSLKRFKPVLFTIASALALLLFVPCGLVRAEELYHAEASQCTFAMPEGYSLLSSTENGDMFTTDGAFDMPYFGIFTEERSGISDEMTLEEAYTLIADMADSYISKGVPEEKIHQNGYYNIKNDQENTSRGWANLLVELNGGEIVDIWMTGVNKTRVYNITFLGVSEEERNKVIFTFIPDTADENDKAEADHAVG